MALQANNNLKISLYTPNFESFVPLPYLMSPIVVECPHLKQVKNENKLDLNQFIIKNKSSTFFARASGDSMIGSGILSGDLLIVDQSIKPENHKIVVALLDKTLLVRRYMQHAEGIALYADHPRYPPRLVRCRKDFGVLGVVTNIIRPL